MHFSFEKRLNEFIGCLANMPPGESNIHHDKAIWILHMVDQMYNEHKIQDSYFYSAILGPSC